MRRFNLRMCRFHLQLYRAKRLGLLKKRGMRNANSTKFPFKLFVILAELLVFMLKNSVKIYKNVDAIASFKCTLRSIKISPRFSLNLIT